MTTEPKLTEADVTRLHSMSHSERIAYLRQRGLIADEPDPIENIVAEIAGARGLEKDSGHGFLHPRQYRADLREAAKRGRGLAERPELTREMFEKAAKQAGIWFANEGSASDLHAALVEQMKGDVR